MKKIFIFTLMVIGYMSFTLSTNPPISSSTASSEFNSQAASSVNSGAVNSELLKTQMSNSSFKIDRNNTSYVDPTSGQLYAAGFNTYGHLGLGYDEDGNALGTQQSFTPIYKSGNVNDKFINPIDWGFGINSHSAVIDADGKLWTAGNQQYGGLGNGVLNRDDNDFQYTFETDNLVGLPEGYKAVKITTGQENVIVMLDNGTIWGVGNGYALGLSGTDGYQFVDGEVVEGGWLYPTFTQIDNTSEDELIAHEMPFDTKDIVDVINALNYTMYLLKDGSLYRCNQNGYTLVSTDVISFDVERSASYYVTESGDVYYSSGTTAAFTQFLSGDKNQDVIPTYEGTIDSIYTTTGYSSARGWAYLTTTGDVYYTNTNGGTELFKIAEDVVYFDIAGYSTLGAITKSGEFKLWGSDSAGQLGNGSTEGATPEWDVTNPTTDAFYSDKATVSTPTTDGNNVTPPAVDPETGELEKDEDGNNVAIIPTLSTPAPANFLKSKTTLGKT